MLGKRGFTRSVMTENRNKIPGFYLQIHCVQRFRNAGNFTVVIQAVILI